MSVLLRVGLCSCVVSGHVLVWLSLSGCLRVDAWRSASVYVCGYGFILFNEMKPYRTKRTRTRGLSVYTYMYMLQ